MACARSAVARAALKCGKRKSTGSERVSANRFAEVQATGVATLAVACPFCMIMLTDARQTADSSIQLQDIAEVVLQAVDQAK